MRTLTFLFYLFRRTELFANFANIIISQFQAKKRIKNAEKPQKNRTKNTSKTLKKRKKNHKHK